jgi:hypothetical protein
LWRRVYRFMVRSKASFGTAVPGTSMLDLDCAGPSSAEVLLCEDLNICTYRKEVAIVFQSSLCNSPKSG